MKRWIGRWLVLVAGLHTVYAGVAFHATLRDMAQRGWWDVVGRDPQVAAVTWFVLFGGVLALVGMLLATLERVVSDDGASAVPPVVGWGLLALALVGVVLMPTSGFWLVLPPAVVLIRRSGCAGGVARAPRQGGRR